MAGQHLNFRHGNLLSKRCAGNSHFRIAFFYYRIGLLSLSTTSCAPPSTMLVEEISVIFAFFWSSGMVRQPQLHMVERTLERESSTLSFKLPA